MNRFTRTALIAFGVALVWGVLVAFVWKPYLDPLIGFRLGGYIGGVGFHVFLAGLITWTFCRRWRLLGSLLAALALFLALPFPSKAGVQMEIVNATSAAVHVTIVRINQPARRVSFFLPSGQTISYRTSPGDYSEDMQFAVECGTLSLPVTIADLRKNQIRLTGSEIVLADVRTIEAGKKINP